MMNISAEIKDLNGKWIRVMSVPRSPAALTSDRDRVVIAADGFEFEVNASELLTAVRACCLNPKYAHLVTTGQHSYTNPNTIWPTATMRGKSDG